MIVKEIMNNNIYYIDSSENIKFALKQMHALGVQRLFIFDNDDKPIGLISYKDIILLVGSEKTKIDIDNVKVEDIMNDHINIIDAYATVQDAANLILRSETSELLVIENNENIGVITKTDICRVVSFSELTPK